MSSPFTLMTRRHITSLIRAGNLLVPAALNLFAGTNKADTMTTDTNSKTPKRVSKVNDTGDVFTDDDLPEKIGKNLRQIYDDVLNEPVPDDFLSLLMQADAKTD